jgi:hypothetical protein
VGTNLVLWSARKQNTVSRSSAEAEYKVVANAMAKIVWIQTLMKEIKVPCPTMAKLWCDNIRANYLSANPAFMQEPNTLKLISTLLEKEYRKDC